MSIHNYKDGSDKSWADINCDNLVCDLETVDTVSAQTINVQDLDIGNFVLGAVESVNNWVPTFNNKTGSLLGAFNLKGGYAVKVNNLVKAMFIFTSTATSSGDATFQIDRSDLPIAKTSQFTDTDRCFGFGTANEGTAVQRGGCSSESPLPSDLIGFIYKSLNSGTTYQLYMEFFYTTD